MEPEKQFLDTEGLNQFWNSIKDSGLGGGGGSSLTLVPITLLADAWDENKQQVVAVNGVVAGETKQLIQPMPATNIEGNQEAYYAANVICISQGSNSLTFQAGTVPEGDLDVYVITTQIDEIAAGSVLFEWWSPHMTSDNTPAPYVASASSRYSTMWYPYNAFDGRLDTHWHQSTPPSGIEWLRFDFGKRTMVRAIRLYSHIQYNTYLPRTFTIRGSNNAVDWENILHVEKDRIPELGEGMVYNFSRIAEYRFYELYDMKDSSNYVGVAEWDFYKAVT